MQVILKNKKTIISLLVTLAMLLFIFSSVSLKDSLELISKVDKHYVLMFILTSLFMSICSTWRYNLLLSSVGYRAPALSMYLVVLVRNLGSDLLPARIGTLVYVWLANTRLAIPMHAALYSFGVALIFDIIAMCPLFLIAAIFASGLAELSATTIILAAIVLGILIIAIAMSGIRIFDYLIKKHGSKIRSSWLETLTKARADLEQLKSASKLSSILSLSILVRVFKYLGLYFFLLALLVPLGFSPTELPFPKMFLGMSLAELSSSLPISGIAGLGAYQGAWIAAFTFLGFDLELAKMTSISHHLFTQFYGYSLGLIAFCILCLPFMYRDKVLDAKNKIYFISKFVLLVASYVLLISLLLPNTASTEPKLSQQIMLNQKAMQLIPEKFEVLFDSNLSGTFGIYRTNKKSEQITTLVDLADMHEVFPDSSEDGQYIVYASAKGEGRYALSDIKLLDNTSKTNKLLAKNGTFPSFIDKNNIIFERDRKKVIQLNLLTGEEREIFPAQMSDIWKGFSVVKPRISQAGRYLVFTSEKQKKWSIWIADLQEKSVSYVVEGCQASFIDDTKLVYIDNSISLAGSGVRIFDLSTAKSSLLSDANGEKGHEYFPAYNGQSLLFAASSEDSHSHEQGSYSLFIKPEEAAQFELFSMPQSTSRWPKLILINHQEK